MAASRISSKYIRKLNLQPVFNIGLFRAHTEWKVGMHGVAKKACKWSSSAIVT
jgi:hypothetical protein